MAVRHLEQEKENTAPALKTGRWLEANAAGRGKPNHCGRHQAFDCISSRPMRRPATEWVRQQIEAKPRILRVFLDMPQHEADG